MASAEPDGQVCRERRKPGEQPVVVLVMPLVNVAHQLQNADLSSSDDRALRQGRVELMSHPTGAIDLRHVVDRPVLAVTIRNAPDRLRRPHSHRNNRFSNPRAMGALVPLESRYDLGVEVENRRFTIAIDGPAAAGKSTVGEIVAHRLEAVFFDTGILYRALAALALDLDVSPSDSSALAQLAFSMRVVIERNDQECNGGTTVVVNGTDFTSKLRTRDVDRTVSEVSAHGAVRDALRSVQREIGRSGAVVMVGRDIGTIVLPDAELKVFLLATPEERARRRYQQLSMSESRMSLEDVLRTVVKRDQDDSERDIAPLRPADDAVIIDSDGRSIDDVADAIVAEALRRLPLDAPR